MKYIFITFVLLGCSNNSPHDEPCFESVLDTTYSGKECEHIDHKIEKVSGSIICRCPEQSKKFLTSK